MKRKNMKNNKYNINLNEFKKLLINRVTLFGATKDLNTLSAFTLLNKKSKSPIINFIKFLFYSEFKKIKFLKDCGFAHEQILYDKEGNKLDIEEFNSRPDDEVGCMCEYKVINMLYKSSCKKYE
jgi:hypothetical protein